MKLHWVPGWIGVMVMAGRGISVQAEETPGEGAGQELQVAQVAQAPPAMETPPPGLITLDFRAADIQSVLQAIARKAKVNIVTGKEVVGEVTIHLEDVSWEQALDAIVSMYGYGYDRSENVILVSTLEELKVRREAMKELGEIETIATKVIQLKYLDAADVQAFLEPQLSAQGRISILEITGQKGWGFGTAKPGKTTEEKMRKRIERETARSKALVVTDTPTVIERLEKILVKIDVMPQEISIETRVMEVARDLLRDIDPGLVTGASAGSTSLSVKTQPSSKTNAGLSFSEFALSNLQTSFTPSIFNPKTTGLTAAVAGTQFLFQKLHGTQFATLITLLEEDVRTNTLSAPNVLTLSGQEARILVGEKYPILKTEVSGTTSTTTTTSLDYYQNIGIELYVVPQVSGERHIDMIIHPVISSRTGTVGSNAYPILNTREAETQVVTEDGDTVVIGGLLKDVKSKSRIGLPFFGKIPVLGGFFTRSTTDVEKIDLLIFITARIVTPSFGLSEEAQQLRDRYDEFLRHRAIDQSVKKLDPSKR